MWAARQNRSQRPHVQERHVGHPNSVSMTNTWATRLYLNPATMSASGKQATNWSIKVLKSSPWARHLSWVRPGHIGDTTYLRHREHFWAERIFERIQDPRIK